MINSLPSVESRPPIRHHVGVTQGVPQVRIQVAKSVIHHKKATPFTSRMTRRLAWQIVQKWAPTMREEDKAFYC